ncbi:major outer membrane protein [Campylobacter cuniculorum]|uniref:Major outer membrane protein n=2 Tax=Campylobacter cuniculorum TaxID=374106 RepID=A0A1W6BVY6_9BACT|nr:major outer membrane protein [Campylobacter cuniculorum]ARJ56276.1 major outer membrane protein [Campylobacter cuniculorum DSM 23162 = LMG 24588]QOR03768.1 major outer membrane protein [Campylobacter cuniculorum]
MKLVKLSLVAALAAGAFSVANATPLDEAIKDVDLSGALRYRYNNGRVVEHNRDNLFNGPGGIGNSKQAHQFVGKLGFQAAIADNFKAFVELYYNAGQESGFASNGSEIGTDTNTGFNVRQYYLTYTADAVDTSVLLGKMQVESIWTTNFLGLVGTGAKILNTSLEGTILAAYAFDNFDANSNVRAGFGANGVEGDTILNNNRFVNSMTYNPYSNNLYGVAGIGSYDLGFGQLNSQLWLAYLTDTAFLYAIDLGFKTTFANDLVWKLNLGYLGNAVENDFEDIVVGMPGAATNGNFVGLNGTLEYMGFDASLGGFYYGDKDQLSLTTLEDNGNIGHLLAGQEIYYTDGSNLTGDIGQNTFGFIKAGYTFNEVLRLGVDLVYGGTKIENNALGSGAGDKFEVVARVNYKYSPKLDFQAWYSYVDIDAQTKANDNSKNSVRLQALYKF